MMIILDFGSGSTCQNDVDYARRMIDELAEVDTRKHEVIIKWQLFQQETVPYVPALERDVFDAAYDHAVDRGYETTASVFDVVSLDNLLADFDVPFVKFACRPWVYPLIGYMRDYDDHTRAVVSVDDAALIPHFEDGWGADCLCCVPKYPAAIVDYRVAFKDMSGGISDHTEGWTLYHAFKPKIYECHYKLEDSTGPDAASFARTPAMLREVL